MWDPLKYLLAGALGIAGFSFLAQTLTSNALLDTPAMEASASYDQLQRDAMAAYPGESLEVALQKHSKAVARKQIVAASNDTERAKIAAGIFMGFWMTNGRGRADLCNGHGVDISPFVARFEQKHVSLHARALEVLRDDGLSEERRYAVHRDAIQRQLSYEMLYLNGSPMSLADACKFLLENANAYMPKLSFKSAEPRLAALIARGPRQDGE